MVSSFFDGKWWIKSSASHYFSKELHKYFVQLYVSCKLDNETFRYPCTGILVEVNGKLLWFSAGHVVEAIVEYYKNGSIIEMRWIDRWEIQGADTLPFQKRNINYYSGLPKNADYGAILLSVLEAENFRRNKNLKPLIMKVGSANRPIKEPEGFVLAGFPWEVTNIEHKPVSSRKELIHFSSVLVCLPLMKKPWEEISCHEQHWNDGAAFYGQILAYSDKEYSQPDELKGMSGGPIFSFYRDQDYLNIELEGIFDSYHKKSRQIRAEPTARILAAVEPWVNGMIEKENKPPNIISSGP
jgi:hypothetical protein